MADRRRERTAWLAAALTVGVALRVWEAAESSLWLDELHTLHHAGRSSLAAVIDSVRHDVHTPFFFGFVHLFGGWEEGATLRWIPIVSSLLVLLPMAGIARAMDLSPTGTGLALFLYAVLPYHVLYGAELRPYCWVTLASAGALFAAVTDRGPALARLLLFFVCVTLGMWAHRVMVLTVLAIGCARLLVRGPRMLSLPALVVAGALGVASSLPWLLSFAETAGAAQASHEAARGTSMIRPALLLEIVSLPLRLLAPYLGILGSPWAGVELTGVVLFVLAVGAALLHWWRAGHPLSPVARAIVAFLGAGTLATGGLSVWRWDTMPTQYFAGVAWSVPLMLAALWDVDRPQRAVLAGIAGAALVMGVGLAGGQSRQDVRFAVVRAQAVGAQLHEPIYTALQKQPPSFPNDLFFRAYAPGLEVTQPTAVPRPGEPGFTRPVVVIDRRVPRRIEIWAAILEGRRATHEERIDRYLSVLVFEPE